MAKINNKPAAAYAKPHTMSGKTIGIDDFGKMPTMPNKPDWTPMSGVSLSSNESVKSDGIKIRGTGAATKGLIARGPMA